MIKFLEEVEISKSIESNSIVENEGDLYFISGGFLDNEYMGIRLVNTGDGYDLEACVIEEDAELESGLSFYDGLSGFGKEVAYVDFFKYLDNSLDFEVSGKILPLIFQYIESGNYSIMRNRFAWKFLEIFEVTGEVSSGYYEGQFLFSDIKVVNTASEQVIKRYEDILINSSFLFEGDSGEDDINEIVAYLVQLGYEGALKVVKQALTKEVE